MNKLIIPVMFMWVVACSQSSEPEVSDSAVKNDTPKPVRVAGLWRGVLDSPGGELPFGVQIIMTDEGYTAKILNGKERVDTSSVVVNGSDVEINFSWYDARIKATIDESGDNMQGMWSKTAPGKISKLPFSASRGYPYRFKQTGELLAETNVDGIWQTEFQDEDGESVAVGEFNQSGQQVNGTFLTPTGDYRFLAGHAVGGQLKLSAFDGAHAFLFTAVVNADQELVGDFWSRDSYHATWTAALNPDAYTVLPDSWDMVNVTTEDNTVAFAFEDLQGDLVQLSDERFKGKPVLINIFGTWCPNCNDEAPVLVDFYNKYHKDGLEIVGLAFEFTDDIERDKQQLREFKQRFGIEYPLLRAGMNDKQQAADTLGFIDKVVAYPTSVFLDRDHQVVNIHSGFAGPGTGSHYKQLVHELDKQIKAIVY